jgi:hypothetical protein
MLKQAVHKVTTVLLLHVTYNHLDSLSIRRKGHDQVGFEPRIVVLDLPSTVLHCRQTVPPKTTQAEGRVPEQDMRTLFADLRF